MQLILFLFVLGLIFSYWDDRKAKKQQKDWKNAKTKLKSNGQERPLE